MLWPSSRAPCRKRRSWTDLRGGADGRHVRPGGRLELVPCRGGRCLRSAEPEGKPRPRCVIAKAPRPGGRRRGCGPGPGKSEDGARGRRRVRLSALFGEEAPSPGPRRVPASSRSRSVPQRSAPWRGRRGAGRRGWTDPPHRTSGGRLPRHGRRRTVLSPLGMTVGYCPSRARKCLILRCLRSTVREAQRHPRHLPAVRSPS